MIIKRKASPGPKKPWGYFLPGTVAQLVEHWTENPGVTGSSPVGTTKKKFMYIQPDYKNIENYFRKGSFILRILKYKKMKRKRKSNIVNSPIA